jgi:hypothetical protein
VELVGHVVEFVGQDLQLVAGVDIDAVDELSRADPRRPLSGWLAARSAQPSPGRGGGIRRKDLLAQEVRLRIERTWRALQRCLDLTEGLDVPLLQHQADVGMCDQVSLVRDDIGVAGVADSYL